MAVRFPGFMAALLIAILLTSCSRTSEPGKIRIRLLTISTPSEMVMMKEALAEFKQLHPDIDVKDEYSNPNTFDTKILTQFAGGVPPDVIFLWDSFVPTFGEKGVLLDLNPLIKKSGIDLNDFYPNTIELGQTGGKQVLLPREAGCMTLCFNKDLFDREKLAYPDESWDWERFRDAVRRLTKDTNGDGRNDQYGFIGVRPFFTWGYFVLQNGGSILNANKTRSLLGSKEAVEAFEYAKSIQMITRYDEASTGGSMSQTEMFKTGRIAMVHALRDNAIDFMKVKSLRMGFTLLPKGKKRANLSGAGGYAIARTTSHVDECFELVKFLVDDERQKLLARKAGAIPSRKSCKRYWLSLYPKEINIGAFVDGIPYGGNEFQIPHWQEAITSAQDQADLFFMINSKVTAEETCKRMEQKMNKALYCN